MNKPSSKAVWGAVVAFGLLLPVATFASPDQSGKLDKALQTFASESPSSGEAQDVIIRVKTGRKSAVRSKVDRHGAHPKVHGLIEAISARLSARDIADLANDPDVEGVSIDADVSALATDKGNARPGKGNAPEPGSPSSPSIDSVGEVKQILGLGNRFTGAASTVAVIDSGIALGLDFDTRILAQYVFVGGKLGISSVPYDDYGHGTHVAGLIGSSGLSSSNKYGGVAPAVKLLSLKVLDRRGSGKTSDVIAALEFAVANKARFGITVINLSLGHPIYESALTDPLVWAVEAAVRSGIVVVVAAGNYGTNPATGLTGYAGIASPGNAPSAITVGAATTNNTVVRTDDRLAGYSSRGPSWYDGIAKPDVLAPGQGLVSNDAPGSTLDTEYPSLVVKSGYSRYLRLSGSSMATAVMSGLVAVVLEASQAGAQQRWLDEKRNQRGTFTAPPPLSTNAIKALLQYSATPLHDAAGVTYNALEQGAGLVNGHGATALAYAIDTTKAAGSYWMTVDPYPFTTFGSVNEPWSQTVFWGTRALRGSSVVDLRQVAWEDNIVWGTGEITNVVWGTFSEDNIVWGTFADEDNIVWGTSLRLSTDLTWVGNATLEDNIVWGTAASWEDNIVWGTNLVGVVRGSNIVWGSMADAEDNIVWGTLSEDNIVWGTTAKRVTALGALLGGGDR
jgi:serine protease AprX